MQMKTPQINLNTVKELLKKLSFLKNNLALLVPVIIVLVAALLFIPTKLLSARLKRTVTAQSVKTAEEIVRLKKVVTEAGQAGAMLEYTKACGEDANNIETLMKQMTMREHFGYKVFPDTTETSPLVFDPVQRSYIAGVDAMVRRIGGGTPPTDAELRSALEKSPMRTSASRMGLGGGAYTAMGGGGIRGTGVNYRMLPAVDRKIVDKLCEDKAKGVRVYLSPIDLDGYSFWSDWKYEDWDKAVRQSWTWQMGYWILQDVIDAIEQMNKNSTCVLDAPVKRIVNVSFTLTSQSSRRIGQRRLRGVGRRDADREMPTYVINFKTAIAAPPCTARFCNDDIDVIHFNVGVIVGSGQAMPLIQELCSAKTHKFRGWHGEEPEQTFKHNQITVLESNITPVDLEGPDHAVYRYGTESVVSLDLICEYIFPRGAGTYDEIKPQVIKDDIAGTEEEM